MKRTLKAVSHTSFLLLSPFVMAPLINWYECYYNIKLNEGYYVMPVLIWMMMFIITVIRWVEAFHDKPIKDI